MCTLKHMDFFPPNVTLILHLDIVKIESDKYLHGYSVSRFPASFDMWYTQEENYKAHFSPSPV